MGRNTHSRGTPKYLLLSVMFVKLLIQRTVLLDFRQKDSEPGLDRGTSFYLLISPQTKGGLFLSTQVYVYLAVLRIGRITRITQIQK